MPETTVLLRQMLYHANVTDDIREVRRAIRVMCSKEDIATVEQEILEFKRENESGKKE